MEVKEGLSVNKCSTVPNSTVEYYLTKSRAHKTGRKLQDGSICFLLITINRVTNRLVDRYGIFQRVFRQPNANDELSTLNALKHRYEAGDARYLDMPGVLILACLEPSTLGT
jgi:hypothetical protein